MVLKQSLKLALVLYAIGILVFYFWKGFHDSLWFAIGGGIALLNFFMGVLAVSTGISKLQHKGMVLGLLLMKSFSFVAVVAVVLMFAKPQLFPFTLGIGLVIFAVTFWAVLESRHTIKKVLNT